MHDEDFAYCTTAYHMLKAIPDSLEKHRAKTEITRILGELKYKEMEKQRSFQAEHYYSQPVQSFAQTQQQRPTTLYAENWMGSARPRAERQSRPVTPSWGQFTHPQAQGYEASNWPQTSSGPHSQVFGGAEWSLFQRPSSIPSAAVSVPPDRSGSGGSASNFQGNFDVDTVIDVITSANKSISDSSQ
jgi:hypothetical protein